MHSWQGQCSLAYEEEFDIGVSDEDEEKLLTVQDFFDYARRPGQPGRDVSRVLGKAVVRAGVAPPARTMTGSRA
ncbi:hypothetical protein [Streptomyces sp. YIM 132580]|uniref:hypothetical protein n=1 Tax=Streptomyces sp. YIM 132580 TaxID=2691958 RepID=UPI00136F62B9|nr:hypothetical protein [Streptomyces sp. YIM 132580]MXG29682.1 hypothetical protein [Streptomyces sp. YIM 132580]